MESAEERKINYLLLGYISTGVHRIQYLMIGLGKKLEVYKVNVD